MKLLTLTPTDTNMWKNFTSKELDCPCCGQSGINHQFMNRIQVIRSKYGKSMHVSSGFRCKRHNKKIGGHPRSKHTEGYALDITCTNSRDRAALVQRFLNSGLGVGVYSKHIHVQKEPKKLYIGRYK